MVDKARLYQGWTKKSKVWSSKAMTSESTLKRFLKGEAISSDCFISLCRAIGIEKWQGLVDWEDRDSTRVVLPSQTEPTKLTNELSEPSRKVIDVSLDSSALIALLTEAREQNLILRTADGLEFILAQLDNFDREIELTRQNPELMDLLDQREHSTKTVSAAEARSRLGLTSS